MHPPRGAFRLAVAFGIATDLTAPALRGDAGVGVQDTAPPGCPAPTEFWYEVRRRNPRVVLSGPDNPPQHVVIVTETGSARFAGRLGRATASGTVGVREIAGDDCREVTTALALITAVTGDWVSPGG